jgi:O-succinylbenzoic acid--CoA ligase
MRHNDFKHTGLSFTPDSVIDEDIVSFWNEFSDATETVACHTSGSTGIPKRLDVEKSAMLYSARNTVDFFGLDKDSTGLLCLPSKYIAGRMMLVRSYVSGMTLHAVEPSLNPLKKITKENFDFAAFTPSQVLDILFNEKTAELFSRIKYVIIGGAVIEPDLEKKLLSFPNSIYATYGMTETVSHIALRKLGEPFYQKISSQTRIGVDVENCLWIEDENLTEERLQTNDVVEMLDEKRFIWLGRRDFVINSGGLKLHPELIEAKIRALPEWSSLQFFISKINDDRFGERPLLVVLKENDINIPPLETLLAVLGKNEMPNAIAQVPNFIITNSGKLNRPETLKLLQ